MIQLISKSKTCLTLLAVVISVCAIKFVSLAEPQSKAGTLQGIETLDAARERQEQIAALEGAIESLSRRVQALEAERSAITASRAKLSELDNWVTQLRKFVSIKDGHSILTIKYGFSGVHRQLQFENSSAISVYVGHDGENPTPRHEGYLKPQ